MQTIATPVRSRLSDAVARDGFVADDAGAEPVLAQQLGQHRRGRLVEGAAPGHAQHGRRTAPRFRKGVRRRGLPGHGFGPGMGSLGQRQGLARIDRLVAGGLDVGMVLEILDQGLGRVADVVELRRGHEPAGEVVGGELQALKGHLVVV